MNGLPSTEYEKNYGLTFVEIGSNFTFGGRGMTVIQMIFLKKNPKFVQ